MHTVLINSEKLMDPVSIGGQQPNEANVGEREWTRRIGGNESEAGLGPSSKFTNSKRASPKGEWGSRSSL